MVDQTVKVGIGIGLASVVATWFFKPCPKTAPYVPNPKVVSKVDVSACRARWHQAIEKSCPKTGFSYLVIGAGFLGSRIIEALLARGETNVRVFDCDATLSWASDPRVDFVSGDLCQDVGDGNNDSNSVVSDLQRACVGIHTIFLTAASIRFMDNMDFQWQRSYKVNVVGTENVLQACEKEGVRNLIFTSTLQVNVPKTFDGTNTLLTEEMPYVTRTNATSHYAMSKAMAEKLVRDANSNGTRNGCLRTICLRPGGLFGASDKLIMEVLLKQDMYFFLGVPLVIDYVSVDNVVYAHLLGEASLRRDRDDDNVNVSDTTGDGAAAVGGEAFYVSNEEPMSNNMFHQMIIYYAKTRFVLHAPPKPFRVLAFLNQVCSYILRSNMPDLGDLRYLTPSAMALMELNTRIDPTNIQNRLGYHPIYTVDEGVQLGVLEYKHNQRLLGN